MVFGVLTIVGTTQSAFAIERTLELPPPKANASWGTGYSQAEQEFKSISCVDYGDAFDQGAASPGVDTFERVVTNSELVDAMDIGVQTGFKVSMGAFKASLDAKVGFLEQTSTSVHSVTMLATIKRNDSPKFISSKTEVKLKPQYKSLSPAEFKAKCGEFVVVGVQTGSEFFGTLQYEVKNVALKTEYDVGIKATAAYTAYEAQAAVSLKKKKESNINTDTLKAKIISTGHSGAVTGDGPTAEKKFFKAIDDFTRKGGKAITKLILVPYDEIVEDWPAKNPLAELSPEDKLDKLMDVAFGHKSLITDMGFITHNEKLFATGTTPAIRKKRLAMVETQIDEYKRSLTALQHDARDCDKKWDDKCEKLFKKFENWETQDEFEKLPERYTSTCSGVKINEVGSTIVKTSENFLATQNLSLAKADRSIGSSPLRVIGKLSLKAQGKTLHARLGITASEWGNDNHRGDDGTQFANGNGDEATWFKLEDLSPIGPDYSKCRFAREDEGGPYNKDIDVVVKPKKIPEALLAKLPAAARKKMLALTDKEARYAGYLEFKTGPSPGKTATNIPITAKKGALRKLVCNFSALDMKGDPTCTQVVFADVELNLISEQDDEADADIGASKKPKKSKKSKARAKKSKASVPKHSKKK